VNNRLPIIREAAIAIGVVLLALVSAQAQVPGIKTSDGLFGNRTKFVLNPPAFPSTKELLSFRQTSLRLAPEASEKSAIAMTPLVTNMPVIGVRTGLFIGTCCSKQKRNR